MSNRYIDGSQDNQSNEDLEKTQSYVIIGLAIDVSVVDSKIFIQTIYVGLKRGTRL